MFEFLSGAITLGYVIGGLFFVRFWVRSRDGLFLVFAIAFWLLAINQAIAGLAGIPREELSQVYLIRLAAFCLIIVAIIRKNLGSGSAASGR
jgi:hypothetical protein